MPEIENHLLTKEQIAFYRDHLANVPSGSTHHLSVILASGGTFEVDDIDHFGKQHPCILLITQHMPHG